jgi:hypothetical protein
MRGDGGDVGAELLEVGSSPNHQFTLRPGHLSWPRVDNKVKSAVLVRNPISIQTSRGSLRLSVSRNHNKQQYERNPHFCRWWICLLHLRPAVPATTMPIHRDWNPVLVYLACCCCPADDLAPIQINTKAIWLLRGLRLRPPRHAQPLPRMRHSPPKREIISN